MLIADVHFRVTDEEKEVIQQAAQDTGKTLSEYSRDILLAASDYEIPDVQLAHEELEQPGNEKERDLHIRLSVEECLFYEKQAKLVGCSVSEYIRRSANGNIIYVVDGLPEFTKQIAKLGVNLNQLTILAHQGKIKEVDLFSCNDTLKQILKELIKLTKKKG